jgi:hypothetical protein
MVKFAFQITSATMRSVRTVPVVGADGKQVSYSSDTSDVSVTFSPVDVTIYEVEAEEFVDALDRLAELAGRVTAIELKRRDTGERYQIDGQQPKIVAL